MTRQRISRETLSNVLADVVLVSLSRENQKDERYEVVTFVKKNTIPNMRQRYDISLRFARKMIKK